MEPLEDELPLDALDELELDEDEVVEDDEEVDAVDDDLPLPDERLSVR
ncbi:hypothetical protein [Streptoalloteichus tenebrarius]|nr:hypothetical protein GCM10020241_29240 [Streptoalloteichus tenebrarius]